MSEPRKVYIGDGVYASHDGYHIWLTTERDGGEHSIALEPPVLDALFGRASQFGWQPPRAFDFRAGFHAGFASGRDAARRKMISEGQPGYASEIEHIEMVDPEE